MNDFLLKIGLGAVTSGLAIVNLEKGTVTVATFVVSVVAICSFVVWIAKDRMKVEKRLDAHAGQLDRHEQLIKSQQQLHNKTLEVLDKYLNEK